MHKLTLLTGIYGKCSKISNTFIFLFLNKMLVCRAIIHKMLIRVANREDPDRSDLGLFCLSRPFLAGNHCSKFKNIYRTAI